MKLSKIRKKIDWYYRGKLIVVCGLFLSMIVLFVGMICILITSTVWSGTLGVIGYVGVLLFVIFAAIYPIGKYNVRSGLVKNDIQLLLDYLINYNGRDDKFYDALQVIFRTVSDVIHDNEIIDWSMLKDAEDIQSKAWNYLFNYLHVPNIWKMNPQIMKEFASELKMQIQNNKIDDEKLRTIAERRFDKTISKKSSGFKEISLRWNVIVAEVCLRALFFLIIFKGVLYYNPTMFNNTGLQLLNQIGADVIAFVLAILTLKAEISSK